MLLFGFPSKFICRIVGRLQIQITSIYFKFSKHSFELYILEYFDLKIILISKNAVQTFQVCLVVLN